MNTHSWLKAFLTLLHPARRSLLHVTWVLPFCILQMIKEERVVSQVSTGRWRHPKILGHLYKSSIKVGREMCSSPSTWTIQVHTSKNRVHTWASNTFAVYVGYVGKNMQINFSKCFCVELRKCKFFTQIFYSVSFFKLNFPRRLERK